MQCYTHMSNAQSKLIALSVTQALDASAYDLQVRRASEVF